MSERFYPPTEEQLRRQRILTPQPSGVPYSPAIVPFESSPAPAPTPAKPPGCVFIKPCQLPDGFTRFADSTGYVPLKLFKEFARLSLLGGDGRG
ncbi:Colicin E3 [Pseudomonas sp. R1-43-08]|nr:Colicin E3 [Pseudomonas sp. R1-43-08]